MNHPRKKRQPKLRKISVSARDKWKNILKEVDKEDIPVDLLLKINVNLIDGTVIAIDVRKLIADGHNPDHITELLDTKFQALDYIIQEIDFFISIDDVVKTVQPITDQILKDL